MLIARELPQIAAKMQQFLEELSVRSGAPADDVGEQSEVDTDNV